MNRTLDDTCFKLQAGRVVNVTRPLAPQNWASWLLWTSCNFFVDRRLPALKAREKPRSNPQDPQGRNTLLCSPFHRPSVSLWQASINQSNGISIWLPVSLWLSLLLNIKRSSTSRYFHSRLLGLVRRPKELQRNFSQMKIPWMTMVMGVRMVLLLLQSLGTSLLLFMALCLCFLATLCFSTVATPSMCIWFSWSMKISNQQMYGTDC